jgi:hypothetical protein
MPDPAVIVAVIALVAVAAVVLIHLKAMETWAVERTDLLDRIQSPNVLEYHARKAGAMQLDQMAKVKSGPAEPESIFDRRPWERDAEYDGCDFHVDQEEGVVEVITPDQELTRFDLDVFLQRYR